MFNPTAPNMQHIVSMLADQHPTEWSNAHKDYERQDGRDGRVTVEEATEFMQILASYLHFNTDPQFGLNGKRGDPNDLSQDAISFKNPSGPGGVEIIDVIVSAGTPGQQPGWNDVTQETIDAGTIGIFVQPRKTSPPNPPVPPPPSDEFEVLNRKLDNVLNILNKHFK